MQRKRVSELWIAITLCLICAIGPPADAAAGDAKVEAAGSVLRGRIFDVDGKTPLAGATIVIYHLSSEQVYTSEPTNSKGEFFLDGLPFGYFDLAVDGEGGLYVATQVVNVPPSGKTVVVLALRPFAPGVTDRRPFPGNAETPIGLAELAERLRGRAFWRSPRGVAVLAGGGGAILLLLAGGGNNGSIVSPITP